MPQTTYILICRYPFIHAQTYVYTCILISAQTQIEQTHTCHKPLTYSYAGTHSYMHTHTCIHARAMYPGLTYVHTYIHTYIHLRRRVTLLTAYIRTYIHTYIHAKIPICGCSIMLLTGIHTYIHTYIHTCTDSYLWQLTIMLLAGMNTYIHTYMQRFLSVAAHNHLSEDMLFTYIHTYICINIWLWPRDKISYIVPHIHTGIHTCIHT